MEELGFTSGTAEGTALSAGSAGTVPLLSRIAQHQVYFNSCPRHTLYVHTCAHVCVHICVSLSSRLPAPPPPPGISPCNLSFPVQIFCLWMETYNYSKFVWLFFFFLVVSLFKVHKTAVKSKQTVAEYLARRRCLLRC